MRPSQCASRPDILPVAAVLPVPRAPAAASGFLRRPEPFHLPAAVAEGVAVPCHPAAASHLARLLVAAARPVLVAHPAYHRSSRPEAIDPSAAAARLGPSEPGLHPAASLDRRERASACPEHGLPWQLPRHSNK